jgi:hypothetical protein
VAGRPLAAAFTARGRRCAGKATMRGRRDDEDDDRLLSPTSRGHTTRGNFPRRFARVSFVRSPRAHPGRTGWPGLAGWMKVQIRAKTRIRGATGLIYAVRIKKTGTRGLVRRVSGDALIRHSILSERPRADRFWPFANSPVAPVATISFYRFCRA